MDQGQLLDARRHSVKLPVDWRFFVKHQIFEALERMPAAQRSGDGEEVRSRPFAASLPNTQSSRALPEREPDKQPET